jgi:hypothetical protein
LPPAVADDQCINGYTAQSYVAAVSCQEGASRRCGDHALLPRRNGQRYTIPGLAVIGMYFFERSSAPADRYRARGLPNSARRELGDLRAVINHHRREGLCSQVAAIVLPEEPPPRERLPALRFVVNTGMPLR